MALSLYKDRLPWVYEEGCALLDKLVATKSDAHRIKLLQEFEELLMMSIRNPFVEELFLDDKEDYILLMELPRVILRNMKRFGMFQHG